MATEGFLPCSTTQLNLDVVLSNGQAFRWKREETGGEGAWIGVARHRVWRIWRVDANKIGFKMLHNFQENDGRTAAGGEDILSDYFQMDVDLESLYRLWATRCAYFSRLMAESGPALLGIRILKQQPLEALFAFICSANNNIARITKMIDRLCQLYGTCAELSVGKKGKGRQQFFDFPSIPQMAKNLPGMDRQLREAGFGYRAAAISKAVQKLVSEEWRKEHSEAETWLERLRLEATQEEARHQLMALPGVGPKVADCICLMALGKNAVVPVDRHIYALTAEIYRPAFLVHKKGVAINKQIHRQIGEFYVDLFGDHAGWIQSLLFSTRLKRFKKIPL